MENDVRHMLPVEFDPFVGPEIVFTIPAIESQLEIWSSCVLGGEDANRAYNESISLSLIGPFSLASLESSLRDLVKRHEALRCSFSGDGTRLFVYKELKTDFYFEDLSQKNSLLRKQYVIEYAHRDAATPFDLYRGPLLRVALFRLDENEHYCTITVHHIVCDGWSLGILIQDLSKLYTAYVNGQEPSLAPAIQMSQYALQQEEYIKSPAFQKTEAYWVDKFRAKIPVLNLPTDFVRPAIRTYKSHRDDYEMDPELIAAVKRLGAKSGCTFVTTLLCAFEIVLYRITGQTDVVLALPVAGQSITDNYSLIAHCVHLLPLRSHIDDEMSFVNYLTIRRNQLLDDYDHQQFTFGSLLKKLRFARDASRVPLVPIAFNIDIGLDEGVAFQGLKHKVISNPRAYENFEIFLNATGTEHTLVLEWSYNTNLFKATTIKRMMEEFELLLQTVVMEPKSKIKEIPTLFRPYKKDSESAASFPKSKNIPKIFSEIAEKYADNTAIVFGNEKMTYGELEKKSNQLAHYLRAKAVKSGSLVPVCMDRSIELLICILGVLKAGGAYVPIDSQYPAERIAFMLKDSEATIALTTREVSEKFAASNDCTPMIWEDHLAHILLESDTAVPHTGQADQLAYVMYTSGSTGQPKGVMIEQRNVISLVHGIQYVSLSDKNILLSTGSPSFDATTFEYWGMLLNGGQLVICTEATLLDAGLLKAEIVNQRINLMWFTSSLLNQWVDIDISVFEGLQTIIVGGEKLSEKHIHQLRNAYPSISIINGYGPTEATTFSLTYPITARDIRTQIPIGQPLSNRSAYILNEEKGLCPVGVVGELYLGGAGVGRGYWHLPELTAERFLPDPFSSEIGAKMYRSGDLAKWLPDGNVDYVGRLDDQVKIRGFRVELGDVEVCMQDLPLIRQAAVVVKEDKESEKQLVAYFLPEGKGKFNKEDIVANLRLKLPEYMIPRFFVPIDKFPLTTNGKVDKKALAELKIIHDTTKPLRDPAIASDQIMLSAIFAEGLGVPEVGIHQDFFELGGHSLLAIKVMKLIEQKTGIRLPISCLFEAPTVEKLALLMRRDQKKITWKSLVAIRPVGSKPALYIVHGSGLTVLIFNSMARNLDPNQPVYGLQARGLNGEEPFDTIEEIAAYYISEILEQNPKGPYCLAGYSFGGFVAFEMAKQLKAMGKEIKMLALFDTSVDNSDYFITPLQKIKKKILRQFPKMKFIIKSLFRRPEETLKYQLNFFRGKGRHVFERAGIVRKEHAEEDLLSEYANTINKKNFRAMRIYKLSPYDGQLDLFRVKKRLYYLQDPEYLGWKPFALKGVKIHEIPGDHKTFLLPPNDKPLAKALTAALNELAQCFIFLLSTSQIF